LADVDKLWKTILEKARKCKKYFVSLRERRAGYIVHLTSPIENKFGYMIFFSYLCIITKSYL
jgi:hypothetical protein